MDRGDDFRALVQQEMICVLVDQILEDWFCSACPFWVLTVIYQISSQRASKTQVDQIVANSHWSQFFLGELDAMSLSILNSILQRNDASERCSSWLRFFITQIARHTGEASDFQISNLQRGRWWRNQLYSDHHLLCGLTAVSSSVKPRCKI